MRITLNRSDLFKFERLVSKLVKPSELPATVSFTTCPEGLQFTAFADAAVLCMTVSSSAAVDPFTLSWATVKEFAAKKSGEIGLDISGNTVAISWSVNGVPQRKNVTSLGMTDKRLPEMPDNTVAHPIPMFDALADAARCVDPDNSRYALGAICLRGFKAKIVSTCGRQALMQDGFAFPWENDVLCPVTKIFGSKELREFGDTVKIGVCDHWIHFQVGNVSFWLKEIEGKFPLLDQFTRNDNGLTWLHVDPVDSDFVAQRLENLPGGNDREHPVYVHLDDDISVRGFDTTQKTATELRLERSRYDGANVMIPVNRFFLKNALSYGISRIGFDSRDRTPLIGYGDRKTFIIMPLEGDEPKVEADKITVLKSDAKALPEKSPKAVKVEKSVVQSNACRRVKPTGKPKTKAQVLEEAEKLRQTLRDSLLGVNGLIREIKVQRRQDKLLRDTVASLRKLQGV